MYALKKKERAVIFSDGRLNCLGFQGLFPNLVNLHMVQHCHCFRYGWANALRCSSLREGESGSRERTATSCHTGIRMSVEDKEEEESAHVVKSLTALSTHFARLDHFLQHGDWPYQILRDGVRICSSFFSPSRSNVRCGVFS